MKDKVFMVIVILCLVLVGCKSSDSVSKAPEEQFKVGITTFSLANNFIRVGRDTAIEEIEKLGGIALANVDDNLQSRISSIENMINQGVDAIIVHEGDVTQVIPSLEEAQKQGILVVAMNSGHTDILDLSVEPDNEYLGTKAGEELVELMGGKGNIIEIYNDAGAMIRARKEAAHAVFDKHPDVKVTAGFVYAWPDYFPDAKAKIESILQANPNHGDISGVYATFYGVGIAASQAIIEAGRQDEIVVVGIDSDPETYEEMKKENSPYKSTVESDPEFLATETINSLFKILEGEEISDSHIFIPGKVVRAKELD